MNELKLKWPLRIKYLGCISEILRNDLELYIFKNNIFNAVYKHT